MTWHGMHGMARSDTACNQTPTRLSRKDHPATCSPVKVSRYACPLRAHSSRANAVAEAASRPDASRPSTCKEA